MIYDGVMQTRAPIKRLLRSYRLDPAVIERLRLLSFRRKQPANQILETLIRKEPL